MGTVSEYLDKYSMMDEAIHEMVMETTRAVECLHSNDIVHNNLTLSSMFVRKKGKVRNTNFFVLFCTNVVVFPLLPTFMQNTLLGS